MKKDAPNFAMKTQLASVIVLWSWLAVAAAGAQSRDSTPAGSAESQALRQLEQLAEDSFADDDLETAIALYRQLADRLTQTSEKTRNLIIVAFLEHQLGRTNTAIRTVRDALVEDPSYAFKAENYDEGMRGIFYKGQKAAVEERDRLATRAVRLGRERMKEGDNEGASRHFESALEYRPDHAAALYNLAVTDLRNQREEQAEAGFQKLIALGDQAGNQILSLAMTNLGYLYQRRRLNQEAAEILEQAVALNPASQSAWSILGAARRQMGDGQAATEAFRRAYELKPDDSEALGNLAVSYIDAKNWQQAVSLLEKATAADRQNANRWLLLGRARLGAGDRIGTGDGIGAVAALESAIRLDPQDSGGWASSAAVELARHYYQTGAYQQALEQADRALSWRQDLVTARIYQGLAREELGDLAAARESLEEAQRLDPTRAATYSNLGSVYYQLGLFDEAVKALERALAIQPDFPDARANLRSVNEGRNRPRTLTDSRSPRQPAATTRTRRLGVRFADIDYEALGLKGAMIEWVEAGSPASRAGLRSNDLILKVDGRDVANVEQLQRHVASRPLGSRITLSLLRDNRPHRVDVQLE